LFGKTEENGKRDQEGQKKNESWNAKYKEDFHSQSSRETNKNPNWKEEIRRIRKKVRDKDDETKKAARGRQNGNAVSPSELEIEITDRRWR
jgi:hypothetical protein